MPSLDAHSDFVTNGWAIVFMATPATPEWSLLLYPEVGAIDGEEAGAAVVPLKSILKNDLKKGGESSLFCSIYFAFKRKEKEKKTYKPFLQIGYCWEDGPHPFSVGFFINPNHARHCLFGHVCLQKKETPEEMEELSALRKASLL